jgi:hypothetical protein
MLAYKMGKLELVITLELKCSFNGAFSRSRSLLKESLCLVLLSSIIYVALKKLILELETIQREKIDFFWEMTRNFIFKTTDPVKMIDGEYVRTRGQPKSL